MAKGQNKDELKLLQERVAELEIKNAALAEKNRKATGGPLEDIRKASFKNRRDASSITYKDIHDHTNIGLYHTNGHNIGKLVGPVHPASAEEVFSRFHKVGIILSINKPTEQEIAEYKSCSEFKSADEAEKRRRASKTRSKKQTEIEKLTKEIATLAGLRKDQVVDIRKPEEVGAGR